MFWGRPTSDLHRPEKAKSCYETAIEKLRPIPSAQAKYAAAIANLAALEGSEGQIDSAKLLYEKSDRTYEGIGDSGGVTVTSTDLATLMFAKKDFKAARRYLARASAASQRSSGLRDDDIAGLYSVKGARHCMSKRTPRRSLTACRRLSAGPALTGLTITCSPPDMPCMRKPPRTLETMGTPLRTRSMRWP